MQKGDGMNPLKCLSRMRYQSLPTPTHDPTDHQGLQDHLVTFSCLPNILAISSMNLDSLILLIVASLSAVTLAVGETGAVCNKINPFHYCTSVDCPFETFVVPK